MKNLFITAALDQYLADNSAFTVVDQIIELHRNSVISEEAFQVWMIEKIDELTFCLELQDGNANTILLHYFQSAVMKISKLTIWLENSVLYFPYEH